MSLKHKLPKGFFDNMKAVLGGDTRQASVKNAFAAIAEKTDFVSNYTKKEKAAQTKLDALWEAFNAQE